MEEKIFTSFTRKDEVGRGEILDVIGVGVDDSKFW